MILASVERRYNRHDAAWAVMIATSFAGGLAVSWHRWGSPLIDCGREMNQPLRLAGGESLYADVRHIYGPFSPYFHAALFRVFGASLNVLYADGILSAIAIVAAIYWLSRRIMPPFPAATATLSVMWLCVFRPAGVYFLPYSFSALHGTVFGLFSLALCVTAVESPDRSPARLAGAGALAALAMLAKTELGIAAVAGGIAAALISDGTSPAKRPQRLLLFVLPAIAGTGLVYAALILSIGWTPVVIDSWLFWFNLPAPLAQYNASVSGLEHPLQSVTRMLIAAAKMGALAAIIAALSHLVSRRRHPAPPPASSTSLLSRLIVASSSRALVTALAVLALLALTTGFDWDKGPYLAMPFLLVGLIWTEWRRRNGMSTRARHARRLLVYAVFALACVGRMILHVRSGGAYASFLVPISVVLFTYAWAIPFGDWLERAGAGRTGSVIALVLLLVDVAGSAVILAHKYRTRFQTVIQSRRGEMIAEADVGLAWNEALAFIDATTPPASYVAVMPEGTSLAFLSGRRNPLREEIATPGYFDGGNQSRAIRQLDASGAPLVLITNRGTREFGATAFGRDYAVEMMRFIESRYEPCAMFGPVKDPRLQIGDRPFFIKAYCRRSR